MVAKKNKICNNEKATNQILNSIDANRERDHRQTTLTNTVAKPTVPSLCPGTCKNRHLCFSKIVCIGFKYFVRISEEEYASRQKSIGSAYTNR